MLMAVEGPYALMVQPDDILISPREVDEHFGTMACSTPAMHWVTVTITWIKMISCGRCSLDTVGA